MSSPNTPKQLFIEITVQTSKACHSGYCSDADDHSYSVSSETSVVQCNAKDVKLEADGSIMLDQPCLAKFNIKSECSLGSGYCGMVDTKSIVSARFVDGHSKQLQHQENMTLVDELSDQLRSASLTLSEQQFKNLMQDLHRSIHRHSIQDD